MHLIKKTLLGFEIPPVLPSSLLVDQPHQVAASSMGAFGTGMSVSYVPTSPAPQSLRGGELESLENKKYFFLVYVALVSLSCLRSFGI